MKRQFRGSHWALESLLLATFFAHKLSHFQTPTNSRQICFDLAAVVAQTYYCFQCRYFLAHFLHIGTPILYGNIYILAMNIMIGKFVVLEIFQVFFRLNIRN